MEKDIRRCKLRVSVSNNYSFDEHRSETKARVLFPDDRELLFYLR